MGEAAAVGRGVHVGFTAARLRRVYADLAGRPAMELVACPRSTDTTGPASPRSSARHERCARRRRGVSAERRLDDWLASTAASANAAVEAVERPRVTSRWYVRLRGEEKEFTTVWLTLGQRTLRYETYVLPAPEENAAELYENLLRRNEQLVGAHFSIGIEDAVFLRGELPVGIVSHADLDRVIGTLYARSSSASSDAADRLRQPIFLMASLAPKTPLARLGRARPARALTLAA